MKKTINEKGITLIALVVTIIILIILAGVSINLVLGDNGIITKAKEAKENTELSKIEEETQLNETVEYLENIDRIKTVEEMRTAKTYMTSKTTLKDSNGNLIVVPEGFKIADDSGINVTDGIVIEDNDIIVGVGNGRGNQYVWIPVGENIKKQNEKDGTITEVDVTLGRYVFADGTNHKDEEGNVLPIGTPILKQSAENYENEIEINIKEISPTSTLSYAFKELKTNRLGVESEGTDGLNTTAINLKGFIDSVKTNGGYYIARYEASYGVDGKANSKISDNTNNSTSSPTKEGDLWNNITQINSAVASKDLYDTVNSDLINSYAWDTAIIYIQSFSRDADYSMDKSKNETLENTGTNGDEVCKINDMSSNTREWTTEYSIYKAGTNAYPCVGRGARYDSDTTFTTVRYSNFTTLEGASSTFRAILYI